MENEKDNNHKDHVKEKIILFIIGVLVGAVISTGAFFAYINIAGIGNGSCNSQSIQKHSGTPPEKPSGDNEQSDTPPEMPNDENDSDNQNNTPPEMPNDENDSRSNNNSNNS